MIYAVLVVLGLCFGSFVNALVWRIHEQEAEQGKKKPSKARLQRLSIRHGRSMCPYCGHELGARDLIPVLSWLSLGGKCRYCHKPISWQYPIVELGTAVLFVISRAYWPQHLQGSRPDIVFGLWIVILTGLIALIVYDFRWYLLPNRLIYPLSALAATYAFIQLWIGHFTLHDLGQLIMAVAIGGGLFYLLFQLSAGKWIGGGDVKLGWLLGLLVGTGAKAALFIFVAAILGSVVSLPLLASKKLSRTSIIPFGPFLIIGAVIAVLCGDSIIHWYSHALLNLN